MPPPDETPKPSPFEGMDYGLDYLGMAAIRPSTDAIGPLAISLAQLCGIPGLLALTCAVLLDQGQAQLALELIERDTLEREQLAKERASKAVRP